MAELTSERRRALIAALEELRVADRILAGIEGAPRTAGQRTWEALSGGYDHASEDPRAINSELFDAQAAVARARALVGLPPTALVEIPSETEQFTELAQQGVRWRVADDRALVRALRGEVRTLFASLHGEDPEVAQTVAPLAEDEDDPVERSAELDDDEEWPAWAEPVESYLGRHTGYAGLICLGTSIGLVVAAIAGDVLAVLFGLLAASIATYVLVTGLAVIRGQRSDGREVLRKHAPLVSLLALLMTIFMIAQLLAGPRGRYAPGTLTMTVLYAVRLHGLTSHPLREHLSELEWAVVVVAGVIDAAYTLGLLYNFVS